jgi:hypothetical protein
LVGDDSTELAVFLCALISWALFSVGCLGSWCYEPKDSLSSEFSFASKLYFICNICF